MMEPAGDSSLASPSSSAPFQAQVDTDSTKKSRILIREINTKRFVTSGEDLKATLQSAHQLSSLQDLSFLGANLGSEHVEDIIELLKNVPILRSISLAFNKFVAVDIIAICVALRTSNVLLRTLDLQRNEIFQKYAPVKELCDHLFGLSSLTSLSLWQTGITEEVAEILALSFSPRSSITKLNLTHNKFRDSGCLALISALPNSSLRVLNLTNNSISEDGVQRAERVAGSLETLYPVKIIFNNKKMQKSLSIVANGPWHKAIQSSEQLLEQIRGAQYLIFPPSEELALKIGMCGQSSHSALSDELAASFSRVESCRKALAEKNAELNAQVAAGVKGNTIAALASEVSFAEDAVLNSAKAALEVVRSRRVENSKILHALGRLDIPSLPLPSLSSIVPQLEEKKQKRLNSTEVAEFLKLQDELNRTQANAANQLASLVSTLRHAQQLSMKLEKYDHVHQEMRGLAQDSSLVAQARAAELSREISASDHLEADLGRLLNDVERNRLSRRAVPEKLIRRKSIDRLIDEHMEAQITVEGQIKLMQHKKKGTEDKEKERRGLLGQIRHLERERTQIRFSLTEAKNLFPHLASMITEQVESIDDEFLARRTRQDYSDRERLSQTVLKAVDPDGQPCVLKSFLLDSKASDKFHTEIEILRKLSHLRSRLVVPIQLVFIDDGIGYIQMPFYEMGDMEKWLSTAPRSHDAIRSVLQLVCQAVCLVHREGIVHRDLKLQNVVMKDDMTPILIDFDVSKDVAYATRTSTTMVGTVDYIPPEVQNGTPHRFYSDIYSLGVLIYKCFFNRPFVPRDGRVDLPSHSDSNLLNLLKSMLDTDPSKRISCEDVVIHPFFSTPAEQKLSADGELPNPQQKLESVKDLCRILRSRWNDNEKIDLEVKRSDVVTPVLTSLAANVGRTWKLRVNFVEEDGVDAGGLTSALYRLFFEQMLAPEHNLFVKRENSSVYLPDPKALPRSLRTVGYMMVRCLLDARTAAIPLAQSVYRRILGLPTKANDLEAVDEHLHRSFSQMIAVPGLDMSLTDFSCFGDIVGEDDDTIVNDQNKHSIISWATNHILVDSIKDQLEALRSGFLSIDGLTQLLKLLSIADLKALLYGDECAAFRRLFIRAEVVSLTFLLPRLLTADTIIAEIEFRGFPQGCQTPDFLKQWLRSADVPTLRSFLIFITEMPNVPAHGFVNPNGTARKISIFFCTDEQKLPTSHTCFLQLVLPAYASFELLSSKLALALQETRFSIA